MVFRLDHEFLLIGKESKGFAKNYFYEWEDEGSDRSAQLFMTLHVTDADLPGAEVGELVFDIFRNYFFHDLSRTAFNRFEDTLKEMNAALRRKEEELGVSIVSSTNVLIGALAGDTLYLSQRGESEAYLVRRRYVSNVSEGLSDAKHLEDLFQNIGSGVLQPEDYVLFCSTRLLRYITKPDLGRLLSARAPLAMALDAINDAVSVDLLDRMSILGIQVGEVIVPESGVVTESVEELEVESVTDSLDFVESAPSAKKKVDLVGLGRSLKARFSRSKSAREEVEEVEEKMEGSASDLSALIHEWRAMKRDKILVALVVLVLILLFGIYLVRHQGRKQNYIESLEQKLAQVELNLNTARTKGTYDKDAATALIDESETLSLEVLNSGYLRSKASEYLADIDEQRDRLDHVERVTEPTVLVDFALANPTMNALGLVSLNKTLYAFEHNRLYEIVLDQVQPAKVIDGDEVVVSGTVNDDQGTLVFLTKANRVIQYKDGQFTFLDTSDGAWRSGNDISVYNNRVYLLDGVEGQIWRYPFGRDGFGSASAYLTQEGVTLDGAKSFGVDGSIYVLAGDGTIERFVSGEKVDDFLVRKAPTTDLSGATVLYTEFEMFQVFILDPSRNRVLVFNKDQRSGDLVYASQYVFENVDELRDLYVDKDLNRIYLLGKSKIYTLNF